MDERIPLATYRLQMHAGFRFPDAARIAPYLKRLGISDLYLSPIMKAHEGSTHGYDAVDYGEVSPALGGEDGLRELSKVLKGLGMGLVVDVVPNHMGIMDENNRWWWDVLENGPGSPFAPFFDIDWNPPKEELRGRILVATLGQQFGRCLEAGEVKLEFVDGEILVRYYAHVFPTGPRTWPKLFAPSLEQLRDILPRKNEHLMEFESIMTSLHNLPEREEVDPDRIEERQREKEIAKRRLRSLLSVSGVVRQEIDRRIAEVNGKPGSPESYDELEKFLRRQSYRLSFWRVAAEQINYRRFFDINELAAIRVELPVVFKRVHEKIFQLIQDGIVTGLRIDHPDGLFNPPQYFMDLQRACHLAQSSASLETREFPAHDSDRAIWVAVEKILAREEHLPPGWAVHGTTGYDFLNLVNGLFVDSSAARRLLGLHARVTGEAVDFARLMSDCKKLVMDTAMAAELNVLARRLDRISEQHRSSRDFTQRSLRHALVEFVACFPVYRSYFQPESTTVDPDDARAIKQALRTAKRRAPTIDPSIYDFIGSVLLLEYPEGLTEAQRAERMDFVLRLQQLTGPVMAKELEDTAFYRAVVLASLNEVGGEPDRFGASVDEFHTHNAERLERWPHSLLATSTHDTKRSEDVRSRIDVISEIPEEWEKAVDRWIAANAKHKLEADGIEVPTPAEEYLLYQTLVGIWPLEEAPRADLPARLRLYMEKAEREAKNHTSWISVNQAHEDAVGAFVDAVLDPKRSGDFLRELDTFVRRVAPIGAVNALAQTLLKITCPGVPDFYQGTDLWDLSLVDPDNRRPVDYEARESALAQLEARAEEPALGVDLAHDWQNGHVKLMVTQRALSARAERRRLFERGEYIPLRASGPRAANIVAFARVLRADGDSWAITVVPRLAAGLNLPANELAAATAWEGTMLELPPDAPKQWSNVMTGQPIDVAEVSESSPDASRLPQVNLGELLGRFPVALLLNR